jgi:glycosyltransferase involved in cell wall biosynthesis
LIGLKEMRMIRVLFIVSKYYEDFNKEFGGTTREFYSITNAFKDSDEFEFTVWVNYNFEETIKILKDYDVIHVDDNSTIENMLKVGIIPDVIGPTARSPTKNEKAKEEWIKKGLNVDDYYKAVVVRNNNSEERIDGYWDKIKYINLGVDVNTIGKSTNFTKKWILWAGDATRPAKNLQMFLDIIKITKLPKNYQWKVMSSYKLSDYIDTLKNTELLINTSTNETFCFAMFEANASRVPSIYKKGLHNSKGHEQELEFHKNKTIQVEYTPEAYRDKILELLNDKNKLESARKEAREYACNNGSYNNIVSSFGDIYRNINKLKNEKYD